MGLAAGAPSGSRDGSEGSTGVFGDSGMGTVSMTLRAGLVRWSVDATRGFSGMVEVDSTSVSILVRRLDRLDSPLGSRRSPMRPSFSIATKLVRTLESGLGEPAPLGPR